MTSAPILTIAVPTYNMERWLDKNLATYRAPALAGRLEVLCLNNASQDTSRDIIARYEAECPEIFTLIDRSSCGYGGAVNEAIACAQGTYFRIVDADDWVDTGELIRMVDALDSCEADVVLTDYTIVALDTGRTTPVRAREKGVAYGTLYRDLTWPMRTLPSVHNTTYRTALLRDSGFAMQDGIFFVDEEYVILPYLAARSVLYYPFDVYRYQVANPGQSTSPGNRAKYQNHRERVLKRLIAAYQEAQAEDPAAQALDYCFQRTCRGIGDHCTTLYIYVEDRTEGRKLANRWKQYIRKNAADFWPPVQKKAAILSILNRLCVSLPEYQRLKRIILRRQ